MQIPRLPMAKGMEKGTKRGTTAPWSPPSLGLPLTTPGPFLLGRGSHSLQLGWIWVVVLGMAGAGLEGGRLVGGLGKGCPGDMRSDGVHVPMASSSSWTKGSLGTQVLDPTTVTQHSKGHFISSSSFFS